MTLYANTLAFSRADGSIDDSIYTERVYKNGTSKYSNLVGADGVLKL